jgi:2-oxo-4-hydroxy-4-carboxy-5-ureidoimidazoline decarboxylase
MNWVLERWNFLPSAVAANEILPCCGSSAWGDKMVARRPVTDEAALLAAADEIWVRLAESDWLEAFRSHPRIGESVAAKAAAPKYAAWSAQEQQDVVSADDAAKLALAEGNRQYEQKFNRTFIVCATGKSPEDILKDMQRRLKSDDATELMEAAEQQRQIMWIRLRKWLRE